MTREYSIDAAGKTLGRIASEAAKALMGKHKADYVPNKNTGANVTVSNVSKIYLRESKRTQKTYVTYTGYPGGLKKESLAMLQSRKGRAEALRRAIERMLPRNTLRTARMKKLTIHD